MIILIPAYEPGRQLVDLVRSIRAARPWQDVVLVDDGSGPAHGQVFADCAALGCDVIGHPVNRGKGAALKTGFAHVIHTYPGQDVVCADCDGQHTITDIIMRVADEVRRQHDAIVLGARQFAGDVPARSRFGNDVTRAVFRLATGIALQDTQTGLRGYPSTMLPWLLTVDGDRFEYELEALLASKRAGHRFVEVPIETIYLAGNESSHFHPIKDSIRVYVPFAKFGLSSIAAFAVDAALFFSLMAITDQLLLSVVAARVGSASFNFAANRRLVFGRSGREGRRRSMVRYGVLAAVLLACNYLLIAGLTRGLGTGLVAAKLLTELTLFVASYRIQRRHVFDDPITDEVHVVEPSAVPVTPLATRAAEPAEAWTVSRP
ncbi:MAG: bifunctional glycosyltransferase family 2/GtrA family protein [Acidimicrobiales bacterium]